MYVYCICMSSFGHVCECVCVNENACEQKCGKISGHVVDFRGPAFLSQVAVEVPLVLSSCWQFKD